MSLYHNPEHSADMWLDFYFAFPSGFNFGSEGRSDLEERLEWMQ